MLAPRSADVTAVRLSAWRGCFIDQRNYDVHAIRAHESLWNATAHDGMVGCVEAEPANGIAHRAR
jgi:hypothetical protein